MKASNTSHTVVDQKNIFRKSRGRFRSQDLPLQPEQEAIQKKDIRVPCEEIEILEDGFRAADHTPQADGPAGQGR